MIQTRRKTRKKSSIHRSFQNDTNNKSHKNKTEISPDIQAPADEDHVIEIATTDSLSDGTRFLLPNETRVGAVTGTEQSDNHGSSCVALHPRVSSGGSVAMGFSGLPSWIVFGGVGLGSRWSKERVPLSFTLVWSNGCFQDLGKPLRSPYRLTGGTGTSSNSPYMRRIG